MGAPGLSKLRGQGAGCAGKGKGCPGPRPARLGPWGYLLQGSYALLENVAQEPRLSCFYSA